MWEFFASIYRCVFISAYANIFVDQRQVQIYWEKRDDKALLHTLAAYTSIWYIYTYIYLIYLSIYLSRYIYIYTYACLSVYSYLCMDRFMYGWMDVWVFRFLDVWMYGCMDGCMYGWVSWCMDGWMLGWMDVWLFVCGCLDVWMFGWVDAWMDVWMDRRTHGWYADLMIFKRCRIWIHLYPFHWHASHARLLHCGLAVMTP